MRELSGQFKSCKTRELEQLNVKKTVIHLGLDECLESLRGGVLLKVGYFVCQVRVTEEGEVVMLSFLSVSSGCEKYSFLVLVYQSIHVDSRLRLPEELNSVHDTFHMLNLKKCRADANLHVSLDEIKVDKTLCFIEEPIEIMDREIKKLKRRKIAPMKVEGNSKRRPETRFPQGGDIVTSVISPVRRIICGYPWPELEGKRFGMIQERFRSSAWCLRDRMSTPTQVFELDIRLLSYSIVRNPWSLLIPLSRGSFDVIVGIDWLSKRKFVIVCHEKVVRIPLEDLVHGATPVVKSPYRLAPSEMQELSEQLQELQDKFKVEEEHEVHLKLVLESLRKEKLYAKFSKLGDALSRKERVESRRVRGIILAAQSEAFKQENVLSERLRGLDQQMKKLDESLYFMDRIWVLLVGSIMDEAHASRYLVHPEVDKTYYNLGDMYWSPVLRAEIEKSSLTGLELVQETTDKVVLVKEKPKAARDRQKSYVDYRRKPLKFEVGDHVLLKVKPWKRVVHFGNKGKLAPRYVGLFEILERIGLVAYRSRLPEELNNVHDTFHVSNLKKCLADANLHVPLDKIKVDKTLHFVEEPVEIMDRELRKLKRRKIAPVKVRWNSKRGPKFTWEHEDQMRIKYP
ncbi:hypothetical protein Tco_0529608 [Tanacetum coccineum]